MFDRHSRDAVTSRLRLRGHDYSSPGHYFITICTEGRECLFGCVENDEVVQSPAGVVVDSWLGMISRRFPGVSLDTSVVMPNHLHSIIALGTDPNLSEEAQLPKLSKIVQWFKTRSTYDYILGVRTENWPRFPGKLWQEGFFEHIVRSDADLERIRSYIEANPSQWQHDENNPNRMER